MAHVLKRLVQGLCLHSSRRQQERNETAAFEYFYCLDVDRYLAWGGYQFPFVGYVVCSFSYIGKAVFGKNSAENTGLFRLAVYHVPGAFKLELFLHRRRSGACQCVAFPVFPGAGRCIQPRSPLFLGKLPAFVFPACHLIPSHWKKCGGKNMAASLLHGTHPNGKGRNIILCRGGFLYGIGDFVPGRIVSAFRSQYCGCQL